MDEEGERAIIGSVNESTLGVVFTKRLYKTVIPQGVPNIRYGKTDRDVGAIESGDMILEGKRYLHSAAGKGLR